MICENCGKEHSGSYGSGRFCSQPCARSFSTKKNRQLINEKVSKSLKGRIINKDLNREVRYCKICNKRLGIRNITSYCIDCIRHSDELKEYRSNISKYASSKVNPSNRKYWMPRNQISYAEKFWLGVLHNYNIEYIHDYPVKIDNDDCDKYHFFLDFYIEKSGIKLDLEIDGKQHTYEDRKLHDYNRDTYLTAKGFVVYRIPWNEINTEQGKQEMQQKIKDFLDFYSAL
jgi:hypothetical protein